MRLPRRSDPLPTLFHVTHYKAGSRWVHAILRQCVRRRRLVRVQADLSELLRDPIHEGKVYSAVYATRQQFESAALPERWRRFVIIRDLRDTLVSGYFSIKVSHTPFENEAVIRLRQRLQELSLEEGLMQTLDEWLPLQAHIQESWLETGEPLIRYEDLLDHDVEILERVLIDECEYPIRRRRLHRAIEKTRFERLTGRQRGVEDITSHHRKGIAGDWRYYFSERVKEAFKDQWADLMIATGYETRMDW